MELGQLEAFLVAVRLHSFSRAAEAIGVTQPSLSARILVLEAELGEPLFHRVGRGVRLTDAGRAFLPYVQRAMDTLQTLASLKRFASAIQASMSPSRPVVRARYSNGFCPKRSNWASPATFGIQRL
jgi:DNA-binding transcriptional LysR family regulator